MLAAAESLTGGRIQSLMTGLSGASEVFAGGVTVYTIDQKVSHLSVDRELANACNAVSESVVCQMALGVCSMFECTCGVATTGYAEINSDVKTPFAWVAVALNGNVVAKRVESRGTREEVQREIAERALEFVGEVLKSSIARQ